jgi:hypothetical protein
MADPIQTLIFPVSFGGGVVRTYQTEVNKKTGSYVTYDVTRLGQKDAILRSDSEVSPDGKSFYRTEIVNSYKSTYNNLPYAERLFIQTDLAYQSDNQRASYVKNNFTQDQINNLFPGMPKVVNTAPPAPTITSGGSTAPTPTPSPTQVSDINPESLSSVNENISADYERKSYGNNENLRYPLTLNSSVQDCIQFSMKTNEGRNFNTDPTNIFKGLGERKEGTVIEGTVTLPIQPGITDSNGVEWGGANLDAKDAYLASLALGGITSNEGLGETAGNLLSRVFGDIKKAAASTDFKNAINLYLAQEAVGVQGLLSRGTGSILNPNLELLFNGPTLRPFNFTFRLSPRSAPEAANVKRIIRFFKEGMSVKTAANEVFLKSPNVFDIKYIAGGTGKDHPSLNRIKQCALLGCDVDYTPDGTYMTFDDSGKTMTSYQLTLRFSELEPIYSSDYKSAEGLRSDDIGF